jgi:hypothetical protein
MWRPTAERIPVLVLGRLAVTAVSMQLQDESPRRAWMIVIALLEHFFL